MTDFEKLLSERIGVLEKRVAELERQQDIEPDLRGVRWEWVPPERRNTWTPDWIPSQPSWLPDTVICGMQTANVAGFEVTPPTGKVPE